MVLLDIFVYVDKLIRWLEYKKFESNINNLKVYKYNKKKISQLEKGKIKQSQLSNSFLFFSVSSKLTSFEDSNHLRFYIAMDNCIFIDEVCKSRNLHLLYKSRQKFIIFVICIKMN